MAIIEVLSMDSLNRNFSTTGYPAPDTQAMLQTAEAGSRFNPNATVFNRQQASTMQTTSPEGASAAASNDTTAQVQAFSRALEAQGVSLSQFMSAVQQTGSPERALQVLGISLGSRKTDSYSPQSMPQNQDISGMMASQSSFNPFQQMTTEKPQANAPSDARSTAMASAGTFNRYA
jgi:hypothetical protein